jgi:hypothetical protein
MLGTVTVKAENPQVNGMSQELYPLYPLRRLTVKLASYREEQEQVVHRVQKLSRFDKVPWKAAEN